MDNYLFLKENNLKKIFFNGYINAMYDTNMSIYNELTKSYESSENYWISRPTLERYLNVGSNVNINFSNWYYIKSKNFIGKKSHRIYLHLDGKVIPFVAKRFIEKCNEKRIQFWFKFQFDHKRSDSIVFYPTDEQFPIFNEILEEIFDENKSLNNSLLTPPISCCLYNKKFGYGKEYENGKSWSEIISNLIYNCSNHVLYKYGSTLNFNNYSNSYLRDVFIKTFYKEYEENLKKNYVTDNILKNEDIKNELDMKLSIIFPKILKYIKNYDFVSKYINSNAIVQEFYVGSNKFIIRVSTLLSFIKFFINDIVNIYGEDKIIKTLKDFIQLNMDNNKNFDISNILSLTQ